MVDRTVRVKLDADVGGFTSGFRTAESSVDALLKKTEQFSRTSKKNTDDAAKSMQRQSHAISEVSTGLTALGVASAAGLGLAVRDFANFDKAMSSVRASTGETGSTLDSLRQAALQAGKDTSYSATEAAGAVESLAKAGVSTQDILGGGLKGALDLAAAGQIDVAQAADVAATAMTQFGLSGRDVPHIADLLAAGAGKAQGEVGDMAMALKQGGLVADQFGLSLEETTGTLAAFASQGLLGSDAGTSFKTMLLALANPSNEAATAMEQLGIHAYDAQGAFIGIAPLAEQLKTKLSGLSQEQRDSALATIFGSDAIRSANVLYEQGAKGISEWTSKVNDQGYASEQAAAKTDNLIGDVERLGGSLETALIKGGGGANDVLRGLAQGADAAVTGFSELPDVITGGATAIATLGAVGGLGAAGLLKAADGARNLQAAWSNLGRTGRTLTLSMGAVGIALTAAAAIYGIFAKRNAEAKAKADDLRATLDQQTGAITGNTRAYVANDLANNGMAQKAKDLGLSLSQVTDAALGNQSALAQVNAQLDAMIEAGKTNGPITTQAAYDLATQGQAAAALKESLFGTNKTLSEQQRLQRLAGEGAAEHQSAQDLQAAAVKKANEQIREQTQDLNEVIDAMHRASGAALSLSGAQISYQQALDDAQESAKKNGKTLDLNTAKGRANRAALNDIAKAANDQTDAMLKSGRSNVSVAKTAETARAGFIRIATQMGLSKAQATALAKSLIDIPNVSRKAKLEADKKDLDAKLADVRRQLRDKNLTATKRAKLEADKKQLEAAIRAAKAALAGLPASKSVTIRSKYIEERITKNQTINVTGGHAINAQGGYYPQGVFGSYPFKSFADGKLPDQATIEPGRGAGLVQWAEGETEGEAFIPLAKSKRQRSEKILGQVANAFGMRVEKYALGGFRVGGRLISIEQLLAQLGAPFNPLEDIDFAGTQAAQERATSAFRTAQSSYLSARSSASTAKSNLTAAQKSVTDEKKAIAAMRAQWRETDKVTAADQRAARAKLVKDGASQKELRTFDARVAAQKSAREDARAAALARANAELARREKSVTAAKTANAKASTALSKAEDVYSKKLDAARDANEAHARSVEALLAQQREAVQFADQISKSLQAPGNVADLFGQSLSGKGVLDDLNQQVADLQQFGQQVARLRGMKLNETQIQQIIGKGAGEGGEVAQAIIDGGAGLVAALNKAQAALVKQADAIGAGAANATYQTTIPARADGGPVSAGRLYRVNERGVELFEPASDGRIVPAHLARAAERRYVGGWHGAGGGSSVTRIVEQHNHFQGTDYRTADVIGHRTLVAAQRAGRR